MMLRRYLCAINRNYCSNVGKKTAISFRLDFSKEDEKKILETVNKSSVDELTEFNLAKSRAQKVFSWKSRHGSFKEIQQMLELDGFGEKVLKNFCESVVKPDSIADKSEKTPKIPTEKPRKTNLYCKPSLSPSARSKIKSCLGVNVHAGGISWAKISLHDNQPMILDTWGDEDLSEKKLPLSDLVPFTKNLCESLPFADAYVFETPLAPQPSLPGKDVVPIHINIQKSQLIGMLALGLMYKKPEIAESTYFLRNFLPSRLFRTKVGTERVSTENIVQQLLTEISVSDNVRQIFEQAQSGQRDLMGHAFLTALTFVRVCLQNCEKSLKVLRRRTYDNEVP